MNGVPLRGAITKGPLSVHEVDYGGNRHTNVFGKAIVDAYNLEGSQQWSGCIVDKACIDMIGERITNPVYGVVEYCVPLKKGEVEKHWCVNWVSTLKLLRDVKIEIVGELISEAFSKHNKATNIWDVKVKIDNTIRFVNEMMERSNSYND
ncbi:MAG TPA: hypothetical protein VFV52_08590 [Bacilli bacterium]|nr:hypothetical protein [Bacilli bacterium]